VFEGLRVKKSHKRGIMETLNTEIACSIFSFGMFHLT
jgi:hypothetical protein